MGVDFTGFFFGGGFGVLVFWCFGCCFPVVFRVRDLGTFAFSRLFGDG